MSRAPFFKATPDAWATARDVLPQPWQPSWAVTDLRWHEDRRTGPKATPIPSARALAAQWGWGRWRVAQLVDSEWQAPTSQLPATHQPAPSQAAEVEPGESEGNQPPTNHPPASDQPPHSSLPARGPDSRLQTPELASIVPSGTQADKPDGLPPGPAVKRVWDELQAIRKQLQPGARAKALSDKRRRNLKLRLHELARAGMDADALYLAARWVLTSPNMRAVGARSTGDAVGTLLRPSQCMDYVELAQEPEHSQHQHQQHSQQPAAPTPAQLAEDAEAARASRAEHEAEQAATAARQRQALADIEEAERLRQEQRQGARDSWQGHQPISLKEHIRRKAQQAGGS